MAKLSKKSFLKPFLSTAIVSSTLFVVFDVYAVCTPPSPATTAGVTITCTGTTTNEIYSLKASNQTWINEGDFIYSNTLNVAGNNATAGLIGNTQNVAPNGPFTGQTVINRGLIEAQDVITPNGNINATFPLINMGFRANVGTNFTNKGNQTVINDTDGVINMRHTATVGNRNSGVLSMVSALGGDNRFENRGEINVLNESGSVGIATIQLFDLFTADTSFEVINSGQFTVTSTQDTSANFDPILGMSVGGFGNNNPNARFYNATNSGNMVIDAQSAAPADTVGIMLWRRNAQAAAIENSGTIELRGNINPTNTSSTMQSAGIKVHSPIGNTPITTINNSGSIIAPNTFSIRGYQAREEVTNSGSLTGDVNLGAGSDEMTVLTGSVINDLLDGGDDTDSADGFVDTLNYDGLTLIAPEMVNWELTNVINGGNVTFDTNFTTETLTTDVTSTSVFADALTVTGDVVNEGTIDMQSVDATGTATIDGNLTGAGTLNLGINVGSDAADVLTVTGDTTGASIAINPISIDPNPPTGNDVLVVTVNGTTAVGDFTLPNDATEQEINGLIYELKLIANQWFLSARSATPAKIPSVSLLGLWLMMLFIARFGFLSASRQRKF